VLGGAFDPTTKTTKLVEPRLGFASALYPMIEAHLVQWACSDSSFVVVALLESEDIDANLKRKVKAALQEDKELIEKAASTNEAAAEDSSDRKKGGNAKGNAGAKILLEKLST